MFVTGSASAALVELERSNQDRVEQERGSQSRGRDKPQPRALGQHLCARPGSSELQVLGWVGRGSPDSSC